MKIEMIPIFKKSRAYFYLKSVEADYGEEHLPPASKI
jgi:hypothetical protein